LVRTRLFESADPRRRRPRASRTRPTATRSWPRPRARRRGGPRRWPRAARGSFSGGLASGSDVSRRAEGRLCERFGRAPTGGSAEVASTDGAHGRGLGRSQPRMEPRSKRYSTAACLGSARRCRPSRGLPSSPAPPARGPSILHLFRVVGRCRQPFTCSAALRLSVARPCISPPHPQCWRRTTTLTERCGTVDASRRCTGKRRRGSPPLAPPLCVCGEIYPTLPYLVRYRRAWLRVATRWRQATPARTPPGAAHCVFISPSLLLIAGGRLRPVDDCAAAAAAASRRAAPPFASCRDLGRAQLC